ncbi:hypothetical protein Rahaq_2553 [Rahnella aceris]|uniref:Uncharacterized protein n=1 Tax=Rahnella sp. (strain Y9602) TaxID=2703885 RepID=A0A0H3FDG1_RAHSY|nr:hypothetical protein [Rahnella aceris]ADW74160.1 hypothetical protein Rahaq_2553 [Rahnella aceris]MBU9839372.1 hypothetical protein [Rahnella aceris]
MKISRLFTLNEEKLSRQPLFAMSLCLPFIFSFLLCIPLWLTTTIDLSAQGYELFLSQFKLPIWIASLSIPLVAIVAHIHRTIQTSAQIEVSKKKNTTDIFFSHYKFIVEAFSKIDSRKANISNITVEVSIRDPNKLYNLFFGGSSYSKGIITEYIEEKTHRVQKEINIINECIINFEDRKEKHPLLNTFIILISSINNLEYMLTIGYNHPPNTTSMLIMSQDDFSSTKLITKYRDEKEVKDHLLAIISIIEVVFQILNENISIPDRVFFYAGTSRERMYFLWQLFNDSVATKESCIYEMLLQSNPIFDEEFQDYNRQVSRHHEINK